MKIGWTMDSHHQSSIITTTQHTSFLLACYYFRLILRCSSLYTIVVGYTTGPLGYFIIRDNDSKEYPVSWSFKEYLEIIMRKEQDLHQYQFQVHKSSHTKSQPQPQSILWHTTGGILSTDLYTNIIQILWRNRSF